jgi:hypothetical protein
MCVDYPGHARRCITVIDLSTETLISLTQAARLRPPGRNGRPAHVSTIYRWITSGMSGIRLEAIRIGGSLYTSVEALQRFADRLTSGTATSQRVDVRVESELDRIGI